VRKQLKWPCLKRILYSHNLCLLLPPSQTKCNIRVPTPLFISRSRNVWWYKLYVLA
jgi:hypothetical protein